MRKKILQLALYVIFMCIFSAVLDYQYKRESTLQVSDQNQQLYVVKMPGLLKALCLIMIALGVIMFVIFLFFKLKGNPTVMNGHFYFSLGFSGLGVLLMIFATSWKITVSGGQMEIYRLFHGRKVLSISEIDRAEIRKNEQIILYKNGKKLMTVDGFSDNYGRFKETLHQYEKLS